MKLLLSLVAIMVASACADQVRYDDFQVFKITPRDVIQVQALKLLQENNPSYNFWTDTVAVGLPVIVMVPPHLRLAFNDLVDMQQLEVEVYMENVQEVIDSQEPVSREARRVDWRRYNTYEEINEWLNKLAEQYPGIVTVLAPGKSYEGRAIVGVKVSFSAANENRAVFLEGGIHAREWIAPATVTYILNEILTSSDPAVRKMAEGFDWYIFPVFNPDGYVYTFQRDRLWRKTRQPYGFCVGADPNRNWGWQWMNGGASANPCLETYAGSSAFSEPETKSMSEYISTVADKLVAYIGFHSFSQLILIPYGDKSTGKAENYSELKRIGDAAAKSLARRYGTQYKVGNIVEVIYVASGGSMDWVKGVHKTPITYTYEGRDTGRWGFILPPEQIIPSGEETLDSLVTILENA